MRYQYSPIVADQALIFHGGEHLWIDAKTGQIARRVSLMENVAVRRWTPEGRTTVRETLGNAQTRAMTEQSNLRVGDYHYFRSNGRNYIGRVNIKTGAVEYVEMPLQVLRVAGQPEQALWRDTPNPNDTQIREALSANLCRCTGYHHIFEAVKLASRSPLP